MPGFSSYDDLIAEVTQNGKFYDLDFFKTGTAMQGAGVWHSFWKRVGMPAAGSDPATTPGTQYANTGGSINFPAQATDFKHLLTFGCVATQSCTVMLYDRLVGVSALSLTTTGAKTVNSSALTRYTGTGARGVQAWLEVTTATTTTQAVVNLNSYTNENGTTGQSGGNATFPAAATVVDTMIQLPVGGSDQGIRSVEAGLNVGTAAAAGAVNLVLIKPLVTIPLIQNIWNERDLVLDLTSLPRLFDGASLGLAVLAQSATAVNLTGKVRAAYG